MAAGRGWAGTALIGVLALSLAGVLPAPVSAGQTPAVTDDEPLPAGAVAEKPKAIFKGMVIACLGDEWTLPNPAEKMAYNCYPVALERLINAKYGPNFVKVIPAGQAGATIVEYDKLYETKVAPAKPDMVILQDSNKPVGTLGFKMDLTKLAAKIKATPGTNGAEPKLVLVQTFHMPTFDQFSPVDRAEFYKDHDWTGINQVMEQFCSGGGGVFVQVQLPLENGQAALKDLNFTRSFRADGLIPTYMGATLIALRILHTLGEDPASYNFKELQFNDKVRAAVVGITQGKLLAGGVVVEDGGKAAGAPGAAVAPGAGKPTGALKNFDAALRLKTSAPVVYFGSDMTFKAVWVAQNSAYIKRVYGAKVASLNSGKAGDTSQTALERLQPAVLNFKPALVLLEFAFADARDAAKVPLETSRKNLTTMVQGIRKALPECDVVLVTTHPLAVFGEGDDRRSDLEGYYQVVRDVATAEKTGLIDNAADWSSWVLKDRARYDQLLGEHYMPNYDGQVEFARKAEAFFNQELPVADAKP